MDPDNFTDKKIDGYFAQMVDYICKLYEKSLEEKGNLKKAAVVTVDMDTDTDTKDEGTDKNVVKNEKQQNSGMVNDHMMSLFKQMQDNNRHSTEEENVDPEKNAREVCGHMERMVQDYRLHCGLMQMKNLMNKYGNENYHKEKAKDQNELTLRLTEIRDPGYTSNFFNVLHGGGLKVQSSSKNLVLLLTYFWGSPRTMGFKSGYLVGGLFGWKAEKVFKGEL
jgi:hypothetical protein